MPSRQRSTAVRLAHTHAQLDRQLTRWASCDVLPWSAWLERMAGLARHGALKGLRRMAPAEEWLAWRAAAIEASEGAGLLMPASLADALRQSAARVRDGALRWSGSPTGESALLARALEIMARTCRQRGAILGDDWVPVLREAQASAAPLLFTGFDEMGEALRQRLRELGAMFDDADDADDTYDAGDAAKAPERRSERVVAASDRFDELRRAAQWSRALLERDPASRLIVIVPRLAQCRAMAVQAFDHELNGAQLLEGADASARFAIEGGVPLCDYPMVGAALGMLALASGGLEFAELAALLRSGFMGGGAASVRAALELRLRDRNVLSADLPQLLALARSANLEGSDDLLAMLTAVSMAAPAGAGLRQGMDQWARAFAAQLALWQWPGLQSLDSGEQQQRERFESVLGELAALGPAGGAMGAGRAVELLRSMASRTQFEPATDDAAVTISAQCGDPLVHYDGIWVSGLNAEHWPAAVQADPFIPVAVQRAARMAGASAEGQLAQAQERMESWRRRARELVFSWPCADEDVRLQPCSLLPRPSDDAADTATRTQANAGTAAPHELAPPAPLADALVKALRAGARLEPRSQQRAHAWPAERSLPRGTRALDLQAACPFRALAELRLDAAPLPEPRPGLDLRERGRLLHGALERVWRQLDNSQALRACDDSALRSLAVRATAQAMAEVLVARVIPLPPALQANESERTANLIVALLSQEKARADFRIDELEVSSLHTVAGAQIRVRMDRVDRLADGRRTVIDYKSGAPQAFPGGEERPEHVQLLIYAALVGEPLAGVASVHLRPTEIRWRGAAAEGGVFPALNTRRAAALPWGEVLPYAQRTVDRLVHGFLRGDAQVLPGPKACERCHLAGLCRIDSARLALEETGAETDVAEPVDADHE